MWVLISQRRQKSEHGKDIDVLETEYVKYLETLGLSVLPVPNDTKKIEGYFEKFAISGIILIGGENVSEALYMNSKEKISVRDITEKKMLKYGLKKKIPVLGICRGMQFINVFFKGKLIKDVAGHVKVNHKVKIIDKGLASLLGKDEINVNSYHKQGVNKEVLSKELKAFAFSEDNLIEGLYHPKYPIAGLQWHPERASLDTESNKKIIKAFIERKLFWKT